MLLNVTGILAKSRWEGNGVCLYDDDSVVETPRRGVSTSRALPATFSKTHYRITGLANDPLIVARRSPGVFGEAGRRETSAASEGGGVPMVLAVS